MVRNRFLLLVLIFLLGLASFPLAFIGLRESSIISFAQSRPWTPTPEPPTATRRPATATPIPPTSTIETVVIAQSGSPTAIIRGSEEQTPVFTEVPVPGSLPPDDDGGDSGDSGGSSGGGGSSSGTATPTPKPGTQPDRCEENDSLVQPCAIPTEVDNADLSFVDDDLDVFSAVLKANRTYTIRASSESGIDPVIRVFLASNTEEVLAENDDAETGDTAAEVQITTRNDAWYLIEVRNAAPGDMTERTYTLSVRSTDPVDATPDPDDLAQATSEAERPVVASIGDVYENNYSAETAGVLAWGVPYDLSLVCPSSGMCQDGDHDFFWLPVKANVPLVAVSYDLGPGADTVLTLYRPTPNYTDGATGLVGWQPVAMNDDVADGFTLRSQLTVMPDWSGYGLLVVSPSTRSDPPPLPPAAGQPGRYRLMVGPPELDAVQQVLEAQDDIPPPPPTATPLPPMPTGAPAPAPVQPTKETDDREVIREEGMTGIGVIREGGATLYAAAPPTDADVLARYEAGAEVQLLGETYLGWVKVQPLDSVTPGWMFGPLLRPAPGATLPTSGTSVPIGTILPEALTTTAEASQTPGSGAGPGAPAGSPTPTPGPQRVQVAPLPPRPLPTTVAAQPQGRTIHVSVCAIERPRDRQCNEAISNLRIEVRIAATDALITGNVTGRDGEVTLSVSVLPQTALVVQIPALGLRIPIDDGNVDLPIRVVTGGD